MKLFDVVDSDGRVILSGCERQMADDFVANKRVPMFVVPHAIGLCPQCNNGVVAGSTGWPVCDACGWHGRPVRQDGSVTPLYGCAGGPIGACDK